MSGVCGVVALWPGAVPEDELRGAVAGMNRTLAHRGPDGASVTVVGEAVLGQRLLSVHPAAGGAQPAYARGQQIAVVGDLRLYNGADLARQLKARGHDLPASGRNDAEVVAHAYDEWGAEALPRLRGMFAVCVYDRTRGVLLLARDPVGEKPLYYHLGHLGHLGNAGRVGRLGSADAPVLSFASEPKALLGLPWVDRAADPAGLAEYLRYGYVPAPRTAFRDIHKLPAGTALEVRGAAATAGLPEPRPYFYLSYRPKLNASVKLLTNICEEFIEEAVLSRMAAEVPLGALITGGLDSTLVLLMMGRAGRPGTFAAPAMNGAALRYAQATFCAGYPEMDHVRPAAARVAAGLSARHFAADLGRDLLFLPRLLWHLDEPLCDPAVLPLWHAAELAATQVKVVLTGDGGDEVFAGYGRHRRSRAADVLRAAPPWLRDRGLSWVARGLSHLPGHGAAQAVLRAAAARRAAQTPLSQLFEGAVTRFPADDALQLLHPDVRDAALPVLRRDRVAALCDSADAEHALDRFLFSDLRAQLADGVLLRADRLTAAHGLEVRAPLLDLGLLTLAAALPVGLKRGPDTPGKRVLLDIARRALPPSLRGRYDAGPGEVGAHTGGRRYRPALARWLLWNQAAVGRALRRSTLVEAGLLHEPALRAIVDGATPCGPERLFALLMLELWHRVVVQEQRDMALQLAA